MAHELVLVSSDWQRTYALNETGAAIWQLCDGTHTIADMLEALRLRFTGDDSVVLSDVAEALLRLRSVGLIDIDVAASPGGDAVISPRLRDERPRVRFVFGIEDIVYFHWQLAVFFESVVGQLPAGWDITVVVCNDHAPLSRELSHLLEVYGVPAITGSNHSHSHDVDFSQGRGGYVAMNRVEALNAFARHVEVDDVVCLMDTDVFLYGALQPAVFPVANAMAKNWIIGADRFMAFEPGAPGIDLNTLLAAMGCDTPLKPGGVTVFVTGATIRNEKVIRDCFRFGQILYLLGKVSALSEGATWTAEMACFAMALTRNGIDYDLLDVPQFAVQPPEAVQDGTFYHYYVEINSDTGFSGPFVKSEWHKQLFRDRNFILADLDSFRSVAVTDLERRFLDVALASRRRLYPPSGSPT